MALGLGFKASARGFRTGLKVQCLRTWGMRNERCPKSGVKLLGQELRAWGGEAPITNFSKLHGKL